jgi:hypothetical protein
VGWECWTYGVLVTEGIMFVVVLVIGLEVEEA